MAVTISTEDLVAAQGKFAAFLAILLERAGVARASEFADLLGVFAATVGEEDAAQGEVLANWATLIADGAPRAHPTAAPSPFATDRPNG